MLKFLAIMLLTFSTNVFAQAAAAPAQNPLMQFLPLVVVFIIFYFLMIRPQKKKFDQEQALLEKLAKAQLNPIFVVQNYLLQQSQLNLQTLKNLMKGPET